MPVLKLDPINMKRQYRDVWGNLSDICELDPRIVL